MHADFRTQHAVGVAALDLDGGTVDADALGVRHVEHLQLPARLVLDVMRVHLEQHVGPVVGLEAALPRVDRQDRVTFVELAREPRCQFECVEHARQALAGFGCFLGKCLVLVGQLERRLRIGEQLGRLIVFANGIAQVASTLRDGLGMGRVIPEPGLCRLLVKLRQFGHLLIEVKVCPRVFEPLA